MTKMGKFLHFSRPQIGSEPLEGINKLSGKVEQNLEFSHFGHVEIASFQHFSGAKLGTPGSI